MKLVPLSQVRPEWMSRLLDEEEAAWMEELEWDYSPVRRILESLMRQNLLPGFAATESRRALAYTYFLINRQKGVIGTLYASRNCRGPEVADRLLELALQGLRDSRGLTRIEAQIMPFHQLCLSEIFVGQGFRHHPRQYLQLDLANERPAEIPTRVGIIPWKPEWLERAAAVAWRSYEHETDAVICEDYCTLDGCESYIRSLIENPGCGYYLHEASFMGVDGAGALSGFILSSRISDRCGMIPQIVTLPSSQGQGVGRALMRAALRAMEEMGIRRVSLTVTQENRRAFAWYRRLGFTPRKDFGAYVWSREGLHHSS